MLSKFVDGRITDEGKSTEDISMSYAGKQVYIMRIQLNVLQINNWDDDLGDRSDFLEANSFKSKISGATLAVS